MKKRKLFKSENELNLCMMNGVNIEINIQSSVEYIGPITGYNANYIMADGCYFLRENCRIYLVRL